MIYGSERLFEVSRTVPDDREQAIREAQTVFLSDPIEPLADRDRHGGRHALPGQLRQFFCQSVHFSIFNVQAHVSTILLDASFPPSRESPMQVPQ